VQGRFVYRSIVNIVFIKVFEIYEKISISNSKIFLNNPQICQKNGYKPYLTI